jgi:tetratricopeptide (TPR) repeat protein
MNRQTIIITIILCFSVNMKSQIANENGNYKDYEESGDYKTALNLIITKVAKDSTNSRLWMEIARLYRLNQQYKQSIQAYERALQLNPENRSIIAALARVNKMIAKKDISKKLYHEFLQYEPDNIMALSDLAEIYSSDNMPDSAATYYTQLHKLDTVNVEYLYKLAYNQWNSGNFDESFKNYKKVMTIDSTYLPVVFDLARIYTKYKMPDSALYILKNNVQVYPEESKVFAELGNVYFAKNEYDNSIVWFEKALDKGYQGNEAYKRLAISYYSTHEYEKSKKCFDILFQKDSNDYKTCLYLGHLNNILDNPSKGIELLNKSLSLITPDPMTITTIYSGIADSYNLLGNYTEQINTILKRQEYLPEAYKSAKYLLDIAEIYDYKLKSKPDALKFYLSYYDEIKNLDWLSQSTKNEIISRINSLKKELHSSN